MLQPLQAGPCTRAALDTVQPHSLRVARLRNKTLLELVLLLYLYQVQGATLEFWIVAVTTVSYMPAFAQTGPQTIQKMPSTALYYIGFKHVFNIVFLRMHIVAGMATGFAIWASCWGFSLPDEERVDSQDAELEQSKHERYQLKGIAHLAFCTKVMTGLWWWAAAYKLKGYTGFYKYFQWTSRVARMMMPPSFWRYLSHNGPFAVSDAQNLLSVSLLIAIGSCVSTFIVRIQTEYGRWTSTGRFDIKTPPDQDTLAAPQLRTPKVAEEEDMLLSQEGIWHATWSLLKFIPAELLYRPYETHASLQQKCLLSLISAIIAKIKCAIQPWYDVELSSIADVMLAFVSMIAISVLSTTLSIAVTVFCFGLDIFLDVTATDIQVVSKRISVLLRLGMFAVGVPVAVALGLIRNGGSVEDLFDEASGWQTALKLVSRRLNTIGQWVVCIACLPWTMIRQHFSSRPDYDSPETKEILASIGTGRAHSQAKSTVPVTQKQRKTKRARTAKVKASKSPLPPEVSSAAVNKLQPKPERWLQSSPKAAVVSDAAHQSGDASFRPNWKPALTTAQPNAEEPNPQCGADVSDLEILPEPAQHRSLVGGYNEGPHARFAAESYKAVEPSSLSQSSADMATAPVVMGSPPLPLHSHAQPVTAASKAAAATTSTATTYTAAGQLTSPIARNSHTGAAAVTAHPLPAEFRHLFPSAVTQPDTPKPAENLPKQSKPSAQSLRASLPSSPADSQLGVEPKQADKAIDGHVLFRYEASVTPSEDACMATETQGAGFLSNKSGNKAASFPDGSSTSPGLAASAASMADQQSCIDQDSASDDGDEATKCIICWTTDRETTLAPCGHRVLCRACTMRLLAARKDGQECICPFCRTQVDSYILKQFYV